ncbi:MAG: hypothetical protein ACR2OH_02545, partial [Microthrixaceae bacterium]
MRLFPRTFRRRRFERVHGYVPNLDEPRSFNEKLQYRMLHFDDGNYADYANKARAPNYVQNKVGDELDLARNFGVFRPLTESIL